MMPNDHTSAAGCTAADSSSLLKARTTSGAAYFTVNPMFSGSPAPNAAFSNLTRLQFTVTLCTEKGDGDLHVQQHPCSTRSACVDQKEVK